MYLSGNEFRQEGLFLELSFICRSREHMHAYYLSNSEKDSWNFSVLSEQSIFKRDRSCYCSVSSKSALHYLSSRSPWLTWLLCDMCSASVSICQTLPRKKKERDWRRAECANIHSKARERASGGGGQDVIVASSFSSACLLCI